MLVLLVAGVAAVAVFALSQGKGGRTLAEWIEIDLKVQQGLGVGADPRKYAWEAALRHINYGQHWGVDITGIRLFLTSVETRKGSGGQDDSYSVTFRAVSLEGITAQNALTTPVEEIGDVVVLVRQAGYQYEVDSTTWPKAMYSDPDF